MSGFRVRPLAVVLLLAVAACGGRRPAAAPVAAPIGNSTPTGAVEAFLGAVKARDLASMGQYWGTDKGSAREQMKTDELEKRLVIVQCKLDHTSWKFVEDRPRLAVGGRTGDRGEFMVELRVKGAENGRDVVARTTFTTVMGPQARWFVESIDMAPLGEFCR